MSFPKYPDYKDSGVEWVGEIPSRWGLKSLGLLAVLSKTAFVDGPFGSDLKTDDYQDEGTPLIQLNNIRDSKHVLRNMKFISEEKKTVLKRHIAKPGELVIAKMAEPVARTAIVSDAYNEYIIVADCVKMTPDTRLVNTRFLVYATNSDFFRISAEQVSSGITRLRINLAEIKKLKTIYPPLEEQFNIVAFLDDETARIDALIAEQQRLIELLKEKRQAVISHAVTKGLDASVPMKDSGVEWLGEVPAHWVVGSLRWYATIQGGIAKGKDYAGQDTVNLPYLRVANVQDGFVDLIEVKEISVLASEVDRYRLQPGDVLMNEGGDNDKLGRGTVWAGQISPCLHQNHVFAIRPNDLLSAEWLAAYTQTQSARAYFYLTSKQSTNLASISSSNVMSLTIPLPPVEEQQLVLQYLTGNQKMYDGLLEVANSSIGLLRERRSTLISAAVTGKIDVRNWQPVEVSNNDEYLQAAERPASYA